MIGETIKLERYAHVSTPAINALSAKYSLSEDFKRSELSLRDDYSRTGETRKVKVEGFGADANGRNPWVSVWFGGLVTFRLNHGWGEKPVLSYRISASSLKKLRAHAVALKYKVLPSERKHRARGTRRPKAIPLEQTELKL